MITFIEKKGKSFAVTQFQKELDVICCNWKGTKQIKIIRNKLFIHQDSFKYFQELLFKSKIPFKVITEI